jgi:putative ABC transport system permease protein
VLSVALHPDDRDPALADLEEEFETRAETDGHRAAVHWYRAQARRSAGPALARRLRPHVRGPALTTELRWAWRGVRARRSGAALHVVLIALAVGASAVAFSAADAFVFRPSPYPNADRLAVFQRQSPVGVIDVVSHDELVEWRARTDLFGRLLPHRMGALGYFLGYGTADAVRTWQVSPGLFDVLGVSPVSGRPLNEADVHPGAEPVALVSHDLSRRLFGNADAAVGRSVVVDDRRRRIVGVMPDNFRFPTALEGVWTPFDETSLQRISSSGAAIWDSAQVIAVVASGVSMKTVRLAVDAHEAVTDIDRVPGPARAVPLSLAKRDPRAYTNSGAFDPDSFSPLFVMLFGLAVCLAIITCLNMAGVEVASALRRSRVYVVLATLGASRGTLVRGVLLEGAMLTMAGALVGLVLAIWGTAAIALALPPPLQAVLANPIDVDLRAAGLIACVALAAWLLTSLPVVWRASRLNTAESLRRGAPTTTPSRAQGSARLLLMAGQVGLSVLLLVVAALFVRTYVALLDEDRGFDGSDLVAIQLRRTPASSRDANEIETDVLARLRSHPAVLAASATSRLLPGIRGGAASPVWLEGATTPAGTAALTGFAVDADYFATMRMLLLAGRFPESGDPPSRIVVDQAFAARFWPDGGAVGARFSTGQRPSADMYEIVGVVADVKLDASNAPMGGEFHVTHYLRTQDRPALTYIVRLGDVTHADDVTSLMRSIASGYTVRVGTIDDRYAEAYGDTRIAAGVASGFGGIAFIVAMVGLYGVTAFLVAGRTREIGIRLALGADRNSIRRLVIGPAVRGVALGLLAGVAGALMTSRWIASQIVEVSSGDPATYAGVVAGTVVTALVATWRPARQATSVDPAVTLRAE